MVQGRGRPTGSQPLHQGAWQQLLSSLERDRLTQAKAWPLNGIQSQLDSTTLATHPTHSHGEESASQGSPMWGDGSHVTGEEMVAQ